MKNSFQKKIYDAYKANHDAVVKHGKYEYTIAYNAVASIHTWIIRRQIGGDGKWHWLQPVDKDIH